MIFKRFLHPILIIFVAIVMHGPAVTDQFLSDDYDHVMFARTVHDWPSFLKILQIPGGTYRPVMNVSMTLDYLVWGPQSFGFHLTNLLLLVGIALCLYGILRRVTNRPRLALFSSLLFVVFPSHHETVTWISGRTDLLAIWFSLLAMYALVRCRERVQIPWLALSYVAATLAYFSKEEAFTLPLLMAVLIVAALWERRRWRWRAVMLWAPYGILLAGHIVIRKIMIGSWLGGYAWIGGGSSVWIPLKFVLLPIYLVKYAVNYAFAGIGIPALASGHTQNGITIVVLAGLIGTALLVNRNQLSEKRSWLTVLGLVLLTYVVALPGASIIPNVHATLMNTRVLFFATIPISILIAVVFDRADASGRIQKMLLPTLVIIGGLASLFNYVPWRIAATQANTIASSIEALKPEYRAVDYDTYHRAVLITRVPDSYYGAFVLRNGLGESLRIALENPKFFINARYSLATNVKTDVTATSTCAFKPVPNMDGIDAFTWDNQTSTIVENIATEKKFAAWRQDTPPPSTLDWSAHSPEQRTWNLKMRDVAGEHQFEPMAINSLVFTISGTGKNAVKFAWQSRANGLELDRGSIAMPIVSGQQSYRLDVHTCPNWFMSGPITAATLRVIGGPETKITDVHFE